MGVAESTKEEVLKALANFIETKKDEVGTIAHSDLNKLGLEGSEDSSKNRQKVIDKYHLGFCNAKTFLKRVNYSHLTIDDLKKCL